MIASGGGRNKERKHLSVSPKCRYSRKAQKFINILYLLTELFIFILTEIRILEFPEFGVGAYLLDLSEIEISLHEIQCCCLLVFEDKTAFYNLVIKFLVPDVKF